MKHNKQINQILTKEKHPHKKRVAEEICEALWPNDQEKYFLSVLHFCKKNSVKRAKHACKFSEKNARSSIKRYELFKWHITQKRV